jgi:hypothetical protein
MNAVATTDREDAVESYDIFTGLAGFLFPEFRVFHVS